MLFKESNTLLGIFSGFSNDILDGAPESHLYCDFILGICCKQFGNDATHALKLIGVVGFRLHDRPDTGIISFISRLQFL